jgi:uncharacterized protein YfdQ (DUF2303 family)
MSKYDDVSGVIDSGVAVEELIRTGAALGEAKVVRAAGMPTKQFLIVPQGYEAMELEVEELESAPYRKTGVLLVATVDSFLAYIERGVVEGTTVAFAKQDEGSFKVVFNYDQANIGSPGWGDHGVKVELRASTAWERWKAANGRQMDQLAFADFVEANLRDICEPDAATIIEMTKQLKVHRKAEFVSIIDPKTGFSNLSFNEQVSGETLKGNIDFCGRFVLGLAPFRGSAKYRVEASLRFNITEQNKLRVYYSLINADLVEEDAFNVERGKILERMTALGIPVFDI